MADIASFTHIGLDMDAEAGVAWFWLNRPDAMNALTPTMVTEIGAALDHIEARSDIAAVIFIGAGRAFCAGADLKQAKQDPAFGVDRFVAAVSALCARIEAFPKPSIAALNGVAVAGGLELVLACDLVVASESAKICDGHANFGMFPGAGATVRLPQKLGVARAKYLMLTGATIAARDLVECGFVSRLAPAEALETAAAEIASSLAAKSPLGLSLMKGLLNDGLEQSRAAAYRAELLAGERYRYSKDYAEGLAAFEEKRAPRFTGE